MLYFKSMKRTKIVATIGPASAAPETLEKMINAGFNVARINFSHGSHESNLKLLETVRAASEKTGQPIGILQDLQGPKIRVGKLPDGGVELVEGKEVMLQAGLVQAMAGVIPVPYDRLAADLSKGDRILLEDGKKELEVIDVRGRKIRAKVLLGGTLISYKGINVPTVSLSIDSMTEKDEHDLIFGLRQHVDFVALSFVRHADDVVRLKKLIQKHAVESRQPLVIVKVEKHEALQNIDAILQVTDGVMIARGDLGLETPVARLPIEQKMIIKKCLAYGKPVITATEMLGSMEQNPRPTRAEVTDVANAVIDHTDAVMLSAETATGRYPVRAVEVMTEIIEQTEQSPLDNLELPPEAKEQTLPHALGAAAVALARHTEAKALVITTESGYSARALARWRPELPIYAASENPRAVQQLTLSWGVQPVLVESYAKPEKMVELAIEALKKRKLLKAKERIIVVSGLQRKQDTFDSIIRVIDL